MDVVVVTDPLPCPQAPYDARRARWTVDRLAPDAVATLRANARRALVTWGLDPAGDQLFAALLVLTELATNAFSYGSPVLNLVDVDLWLHGGRLTAVVHDSTHEEPTRRNAGNDDESGRGLLLVDAYADEAGCEHSVIGKRVWAVVGPTPAADQCAPPPVGAATTSA